MIYLAAKYWQRKAHPLQALKPKRKAFWFYSVKNVHRGGRANLGFHQILTPTRHMIYIFSKKSSPLAYRSRAIA